MRSVGPRDVESGLENTVRVRSGFSTVAICMGQSLLGLHIETL